MFLRLLLMVVIGGMIIPSAFASDDFEKNNPDIKKYEFARSYISALSYMRDIDDRWNKDAPKKLFAKQKDKMIKATLEDLSLDNSDLRVIKNYLGKYLNSPNPLMRRVIAIATSRA